MDRIWVVIQETKLDDDGGFEYDLLSAWSERELAEKERQRLRDLNYRRTHVYPVKFNG